MKTNALPRLIQLSAKLATIGTFGALAGTVYGGSFSDLLDGLKDGSKPSLDVRARYEYNETPGSEINGYGVRTRLGFATGEYEGLKAFVELEDVSFANDDDRPPLDAPTTELNQIWFSYGGAKVGRQIYVLDDQRFIGHVGWRQNIQTYDSVSYGVSPSGRTDLSFAYLDAVHRVNATSQDLSGIVVNGSAKLTDPFSLSAFAYLLDFNQAVLASSDTYGLRGSGAISGDAVSYAYGFSYAKQRDNGGSVNDFELDYLSGDFTAKFGEVSVTAGMEILGGDGTTGFTTPLATVHKFNGFADLFAGPSLGLGGGLPQGLEDYHVTFGFPAGDVQIAVAYHSFETQNVSDFLGDEIDVVATYKLNEYTTLIGKFADYDADGPETVGYGVADKQVLTLEANIAF